MFQQVNIFFFIMYLFEKIVVYQSCFKIPFFFIKTIVFQLFKNNFGIKIWRTDLF